MYNVSMKVTQQNLSDLLDRLRGLVMEECSIQAVDQEAPTPPAITANVPLPPAGQKTPKRKKPKRRGHRSYGTQEERTRFLLLQIGVQPFPVSRLIEEAHRLGIDKTALYRVIREQITEGNLVRVEPGIYQRTGQGFSQSLGLAVNQ